MSTKVRQDYFEHIAELRRYSDNLGPLLVAATMAFPGGTKPARVTAILRNAGDEVRANAIRYLVDRFENHDDDKEKLWESKIANIVRLWPTEIQHRGPRASEQFARLAVAAGNAFGKVVNEVREYLLRSDNLYWLKELLEQDYPRRFPNETLMLLHRTLNEEREWSYGRLDECLTRISEVDPEITSEPEWRRLREFAARSAR